jgi:hypothetical protein
MLLFGDRVRILDTYAGLEARSPHRHQFIQPACVELDQRRGG